MALHNIKGAKGEQLAHDYLVSQGYAIVDRNAHIGHYELDIVAMHGNRLVFVEVKTRTAGDFDPLDAMTPKKIAYLCRAANAYVQAHNLPHEVQFDVIAVTLTPGGSPIIEHYPDAFLPPLGGAK